MKDGVRNLHGKESKEDGFNLSLNLTQHCKSGYARLYANTFFFFMRTSLVVQWLRLHTSQWKEPGFHPWSGNQLPQARTKIPVCCN